MKILVLGGTAFLGRFIVETAIRNNHEVTLFHRGKHGPYLFPQLEKIMGDRDGEIEKLKGRKWDAVIDTCGYLPRVVAMSGELLKDQIGHYTFISSCSVYKDQSPGNISERSETIELDDPFTEEITGKTFGPLKALCESRLQGLLGEKLLVVRPGLIVGPYDYSDRFNYWVDRISQGGEVLVPGRKKRFNQIIDVRDLAEWTIRMVERSVTGTYNITGPEEPLTMESIMKECKRVTQSDSAFTWISDEFLGEDVLPFVELPLWVPETGAYFEKHGSSLGLFSNEKALELGLTFRTLAETIEDTLTWLKTRPDDHVWRAGLTKEKEDKLLTSWKEVLI